MLKLDEIKSVEWETTDEDDDDGDSLYEGNLTVIKTDGTILRAHLDWVRQYHLDLFIKGDVEAVIDYEQCYGPIEF